MGYKTEYRLDKVLNTFQFAGIITDCEHYGNGHINDTYLVKSMQENMEHRYILQRINHSIFKDVPALMKNIDGVTSFLKVKILAAGGDPDRETLTLVRTRTDEIFHQDEAGNYWRAYLFVDHTISYDAVERPEDFMESGRAFGHFQQLLSDYPVHLLTESIPDFHNTPKRFQTFLDAVEQDPCGRASGVTTETKFIVKRMKDLYLAQNKLNSGELPLRVTHNDTKLNNILLDEGTGKAVCIIDFDTIMPGLSAFDFGDSIRFGANTALEDETDLSKVSLSLPLFEAFTKGFLEGCHGSLTNEELHMLPMGAKIMTLECGMRFLTDYILGDVYFKIHRPHHNLDRCRTQLMLVSDMEQKWSEMEQIVTKYSH